jgi:hypothetical protein
MGTRGPVPKWSDQRPRVTAAQASRRVQGAACRRRAPLHAPSSSGRRWNVRNRGWPCRACERAARGGPRLRLTFVDGPGLALISESVRTRSGSSVIAESSWRCVVTDQHAPPLGLPDTPTSGPPFVLHVVLHANFTRSVAPARWLIRQTAIPARSGNPRQSLVGGDS